VPMTRAKYVAITVLCLLLTAAGAAAGAVLSAKDFAADLGDDLEWAAHNVPLFDCPDADIRETYYFRWRVYHRHLKQTTDGWVVTEFLPDVPWAGKHNTISCAAGHHLYEGRWIRDPQYLDQYTTFWFRRGGEP